MKLLLVGLDNAGKTTIVRFLALGRALLQFWYLQPAAPSSGRCCRCCCRRRRRRRPLLHTMSNSRGPAWTPGAGA